MVQSGPEWSVKIFAYEGVQMFFMAKNIHVWIISTVEYKIFSVRIKARNALVTFVGIVRFG